MGVLKLARFLSWREPAKKSLLALIAALAVTQVPLPTPEAPYGFESLSLKAMQLLVVLLDPYVAPSPSDQVWPVYARFSLILAVALVKPLLEWQLFDLLAPPSIPLRRATILLAVTCMTFAFPLGIAFGYLIVLPASQPFLVCFHCW